MLNILKIDTNYDSFKPYITDDSGVLVPYPMGAVFGATDKIKLLFVGDYVPSQMATVTFKARYKGIEIAHGEFSYDVAESAYLGQIWWGGDIARGVLAGDESVLTACAFVVEQDGIITEWQFPLNLFASASGIESDVEMSKKWSDKASEFAHQAQTSAEQAEASAVSSANSAQSALNSAQNAGASATQAEQARDEARAIQASVEAIGSEQISAINAEGTEQVSLINQAGQTNVGNVNQAGTTNIGKVKEMCELWQAEVVNVGREQVRVVSAQGTMQVGKVATAGNSQVANVSDEGSKQVDKVALAGSEWFAKVATEGSEQKVAIEQTGTNALAEITTKVGDASEYAFSAFEYGQVAILNANDAKNSATCASESAFKASEYIAEFCKCKGGYAKLAGANSFTGMNYFCIDSVYVGAHPVLTTGSKIASIGQQKYSVVDATEGSINFWISNNPEATCGVSMSISSQCGFKMESKSTIGIKSVDGSILLCSDRSDVQVSSHGNVAIKSTIGIITMRSDCDGIYIDSGSHISMCSGLGIIMKSYASCTTNLELDNMQIAFLKCGMETFLSRDNEGYLVIDGHRIVTEA